MQSESLSTAPHPNAQQSMSIAKLLKIIGSLTNDHPGITQLAPYPSRGQLKDDNVQGNLLNDAAVNWDLSY